MISFQFSSLSGPTVSFWYTCPDWVVSIGLLSSRPSTSLYRSTAFLHIVLKCFYPTGHSWCQLRVTSYNGDDGWRHSLSLSIQYIAMCVGTVSTNHFNCGNTQGWVAMRRSRDFCLAVIGVGIVLAENGWTLINHHVTTSLSDHSWPRNRDRSQWCNSQWVSPLANVAQIVGRL